MRPKQRYEKGSGDRFRARLDQIIDMKHELVQLVDEIDWAWIDDQVAESFLAAG
jgi:IS5 family transposase